MDVLARPAAGCEVSVGDFTDITPVEVVSVDWLEDGVLRVSFASDLTAAQQLAVRLRITSQTSAEEQVRVAAASFLTNQSPTLADAVVQLRRLTRIVLTLDS